MLNFYCREVLECKRKIQCLRSQSLFPLPVVNRPPRARIFSRTRADENVLIRELRNLLAIAEQVEGHAGKRETSERLIIRSPYRSARRTSRHRRRVAVCGLVGAGDEMMNAASTVPFTANITVAEPRE